MQTILLIDDDPTFLMEAERMLVEAGYRVLKASSGEEAIRIFEQKRQEIGLAIIDLSLPGINGYELIGALSRRPNAVKVIATSGVFEKSHLEAALTVGAHAVLHKPESGRGLPVQQWLETIQQLIGSS
jgi:two-component system cell cycle sensor histidine kinase/response regulator CckA